MPWRARDSRCSMMVGTSQTNRTAPRSLKILTCVSSCDVRALACVGSSPRIQVWKAMAARSFGDRLLRPRRAVINPARDWQRAPGKAAGNIPGSLVSRFRLGALATVTVAYRDGQSRLAICPAAIGTRSLSSIACALLDVLEPGQTRSSMGNADVVWYPDGTDGWEAAAPTAAGSDRNQSAQCRYSNACCTGAERERRCSIMPAMADVATDFADPQNPRTPCT